MEQCTEGMVSPKNSEATRLAPLATLFRLEQASAATRHTDLYATQRAEIIAAEESHMDERYAVWVPVCVRNGCTDGPSGSRRAQSTFRPKEEDRAAEYMFNLVESQYKRMQMGDGVNVTGDY